MGRLSNRLSSVISASLAGSLLSLPVMAHKTEVSGDVAGIWHLEPNHSPKAGESARVWVALTQQGGKLIPLEQCACQLSVYEVGGNEDSPVLQPELEPISADGFQGIPGAEVTFPEIGEYRLVLMGSPQGEGSFAPFQLSYTTVVAAGRDRTNDSTAQTESVEGTAPADDSANLEKSQAFATEDIPIPTGELSSEANSTNQEILWLVGGSGITFVALAAAIICLRARQSNG